jgi:hypothetical protein
MLTSFFGKSSPINYLILGILIFVAYLLSVYSGDLTPVSLTWLAKHFFFIAASVFLMLLLDFLIRKNNLTKNNTYGILFLSCFLIALPEIFRERNILIANIFILLSLRKILSFRNNKNIDKKILDATVWIMMASFFYFWSLLFFFVVYMALIRKSDTKFKQLLIPITGFLGMFAIATAFFFLVSNSFSWFFSWQPVIGLNFSEYNKFDILLPVAVMIALLIWTGLWRFFKLPSIQKKERPNAFIVFISLITAVFIALASPEKTSAEILFIISPLAIIITNYVENSKEFWFREILLWLVALLPVVVLILLMN